MYEIKYLLDVHIPKAVAHGLVHRGEDVLRCAAEGMSEATDQEILQWATHNGRVVVIRGSDFLGLHQEGVEHAGITYIGGPGSIGDLTRIIHEFIYCDAKLPPPCWSLLVIRYAPYLGIRFRVSLLRERKPGCTLWPLITKNS